MKHRAWLLVVLALGCAALSACSWNPKKPYEREAPEVKDAIKLYEAHDASAAAHTLEDYLSTGPCSEGSIGTPDFVKKRPNGTFDLSLSLFAVAESYGARFGDENKGKGGDDAVHKIGQSLDSPRSGTVECALRVLAAINEERDVPLEVRAQARYLQGNLHFLNAKYKDAVLAYDASLTLMPATRRVGASPDAGTTPSEDAAWNRAIALRRDEDESKDAGPDAAPNDGGDKGDGGEKGDGGGENPDAGSQNPDAGNQGEDGGSGDQSQDPSEAKKAQPDPAQDRAGQEDRILDQFDNAKTVQQEAARKAGKRHPRGLVDK